MHCPSFESIVDAIDQRRSSADAHPDAAHIAGCSNCSETAIWYEGLLAAASADMAIEPPAWLTRRAIEMFTDAREAAKSRGVRGLITRLRAALVFDSFGASLGDAIPARRGPATEARQLLFSASPYDVDMLVAADADRVRVTGQVLGTSDVAFEGVAGLRVEVDGADGTISATTSEFGEFTLEGLVPGKYDVRLVGEQREIVISDAPISVR